MVARDKRDDIYLFRLEAPEISIFDQIVRMLVMPFVADVYADVVKQGRVFEPLAFAIGERVHGARLLEDGHSETGDLIGVLGPIIAPLRQLDNAAAANVGVAVRLSNFLPVSCDVVQYEPFTQRHVA